MDLNRLETYTKDDLRQRNLVLGSQPGTTDVLVCVGKPDGFIIGWVTPAPHPFRRRGTAWLHTARHVPWNDERYWSGQGAGLEYEQSPMPELTIDGAIGEVLRHARYGDILVKLQLRSGEEETYTATTYAEGAEWLAGVLSHLPGEHIIHLGGGRIRISNIAVTYLRGQPMPYVDASNRLYLESGRVSYQLTREQ
ncbi:hypothetical protein AB5J72_36030 [Streptomyces sp. CG1]|uniref:hypothetical protein n=1 Tax=Streptomyces sp. CG1 TaxID=1287523 RepID=UPI0034E1CEA6